MSSARRLGELAELVGGRVQGSADRRIVGLATLANAGPSELSFVIPAYRSQAGASAAGAFLVDESLSDLDGDLLIAADPRLALGRLIAHFHQEVPQAAGVHPTAVIDPSAEVAESASIGPYCVVGASSRVDDGARLEAHVVLGEGCSVGANSVIHPHVVLYARSSVGARTILHSGVVLGSDGYGFASGAEGHSKLQHVGRVVVEDDVEIGANCAVDRALLDETRIGEGTKIDNLVQVGHNARIGSKCLLVSQVGISGSTRLGDGVVMAGQSGVAGHLEIGDGGRVAAKSAVFKSVPAGQTVAGIPAIEAGRWRRAQAIFQKLSDLRRRILKLERNLDSDE